MNPDKRIIIFMISLLLFILLSINTASSAIPIQLSDQGTSVRSLATGFILDTGNLTIEIYDAASGGNKIWNNSYTNAIINGSWNVMLGEVLELNLTYGEKYWKDYRINNADINYTNATGGTIARRAFYSPLGRINKTFVENGTNVFVDISGDVMIGNLNLSTGDINIDSGNLRVIGNLNVTGTSYLGNLIIDAENISVTNILPRNADTGVTVRNGSGGRLLFTNTTSGRVEIWNPLEAANDYLSLQHDGTQSVIKTGSGDIYLYSGGTSLMIASTTGIFPGASNNRAMGSTSLEWQDLYLGEDAGSGAYFGLDQDWRLFYNETAADALVLQNKTGQDIGMISNDNITLYTDKLYVWDDAKGANDYVSIYHDGGNAFITTASGKLATNKGFVPDVGNQDDLGSASNEWQALLLGEDAGSGTYFGLDQDVRQWYNSTNRTLFIESNASNVSVIAPEFRVYDDAKAADDYVSIYHDGTNSRIIAGSGAIRLGTGGLLRYYVADTSIYAESANAKDLGAATNEWRALYLGENASSGTYYGLGQNYRTFYDTWTGLNTTGLLNYTLDSDVKITGKLYGGSTIEVGDSVQITGDLNVTGTSYLGDIVLNSSNITVSNLIGRGGDNIRIGDAGVDTHSLAADDDLFVSGKLEVDGNSYLDGSIYFYGVPWFYNSLIYTDNIMARFGTSSDSSLDWSAHQATEHTVVWGLGDTANSIIFTDTTYKDQDHDHPAQSNPTIFMHSDESPNNDNTRWGSVSHDNDSFVIDSGSDEIVMDDETYFSDNLTMGDNTVGTDALVMYDNGTHFIFETANPLVFNQNITAEDAFAQKYLFAHTNRNISVTAAGTWYNVTFDEEATAIKEGITHTHNDNTNMTFTIGTAGIYSIEYMMDFEDAASNPTSHIAGRVTRNGDEEIHGSSWEISASKQNAEIELVNQFMINLTANDVLRLQFTSDATTVDLVTSAVFGDHPDSAGINIERVN